MAKVIKTIAAENGMTVDEVCSFKTQNYVGIYSHNHNDFMLVSEIDLEFRPCFIGYKAGYGVGYCDSMEELDELVYQECNEHICEVFDTSSYTITLTGVD